MRRAFTLIELLLVISLVAVAAAMVLHVPGRGSSEVQVRSAAVELAGTLRQVREQAIRRRAIFAVSFNIQNAPGSSGLVLNNRSGGHWYRILGPDPFGSTAFGVPQMPPLPNRQRSAYMDVTVRVDGKSDNPVRHFLAAVSRSWSGEPVRLVAGKVRFLALTDQDNGNFREPGDVFAPTYPRPWFGWYDTAANRLRPWGGYDPQLPATVQRTAANRAGSATAPTNADTLYRPRTQAGRTLSHSGFFYEGFDGQISGSRQPSDRWVVDDTNNDGVVTANVGATQDDFTATARFRLWKADDPRPLINGDWCDYLLVFKPDGTVDSRWLPLRHEYAKFALRGPFQDRSVATGTVETAAPPGGYLLSELGPFDQCNLLACNVSAPSTWQRILQDYPEGSSFVARSGSYFITLAPDAGDDNDVFAGVQAALRSVTPMYRVAVGRYGDVRVVRVRTADDLGRVRDPTVTGSLWQDKPTVTSYYQGQLLTNADGTPRGTPITDVLTPEMMSERSWWWQ
ncbi:MAG: type II secretion system protein [Planctomycetes bacterium]|nr:type II secretion system protein [Planctomycetota bacterium]